MADAPGPWPKPELLDTPRRRFGRAQLRDVALLLPWIAVLIAASVLVGRWAAWAALAAVLAVRAARLAATRTTSSMRRAGIHFVRLGTGDRPEAWRLVLYQLGPFVAFGAFLVAGRSVPWAFPVAAVAYLAIAVWAERRARRRGLDAEGTMALAGLDVWWAGDPPTPSGTTGPPAPALPPPTPPGPARPGPAPRRARPGRP